MKNNLNCLAALRGQDSSNGELVLVSSSTIQAESLCFAPVLFVQGLGELVWQRTVRNSSLGVPMRTVGLVKEAEHALNTGPLEVLLALQWGNWVGRDFVNLCCSS